jgi:CemA family
MTSTLPNKQTLLLEKIQEYLRFFSQRITRTPERSLEVAYDSVMKIRAIEEEYLNQNENLQPSDFLQSFMRADIDKHLTNIKLRLAEFKTSCFVLGSLSQKHLAKLKAIEETLDKYTVNYDNSSDILMLSPTHNSEKLNFESDPGKPGVLPRSIGITFNKIKSDFNPKAEEQYVKKFRTSRTKGKIAVKFLLTLIIVPLLIQHFSKQFLVNPVVEHFRHGIHTPVFLNSEMKEEALSELKMFEESLQFDSLVKLAPALSSEEMEAKLQHKASEITKEYGHKSNSAVSNVFADMFALLAFGLVILLRRKEVIILKSFMDDIVYGLSDSAKAFIIILFTDIFVGFHSPHGWEVLLEGLASHLGLPANHSFIFLFIATFPVILDTILKYWIFRYLSRISPSAVATLRNMNE